MRATTGARWSRAIAGAIAPLSPLSVWVFERASRGRAEPPRPPTANSEDREAVIIAGPGPSPGWSGLRWHRP